MASRFGVTLKRVGSRKEKPKEPEDATPDELKARLGLSTPKSSSSLKLPRFGSGKSLKSMSSSLKLPRFGSQKTKTVEVDAKASARQSAEGSPSPPGLLGCA